MKIAVIIARVLVGGMFIFAAVAFFAKMNPGKLPEITPAGMKFNEGLMASGVFTVVKVVELICGLAILTGFFMPLALVVIAPILFNIVMFHALHEPTGLPMTLVLLLLHLFLAYSCRKNYEGLLKMKRMA